MSFRYALYILSSLLFASQTVAAKGIPPGFRIHTDLPIINDDKNILLDVFYSTDSSFTGVFQVQFFKYQTDEDSTLVLNKKNLTVVFKKGVNKIRLDFGKTDSNTTYASKFYEILKRTENVTPGSYKVFLTVKDSDRVIHSVYIHEIDSTLSPNSPIRKDINKNLAPKSKSFLGMRLNKVADHAGSSDAGKSLLKAKNKVDKAARKRGLTAVQYEKNKKSYVDLFYDDWFAGRYEVKDNQKLSKHLNDEENLNGGSNSVNSNSMDHPSMVSQYKSNNKSKKDDEVKGEIALNTNLSSGQEQYSGVDNNYYEVRGRIQMPIASIPVEVEGYYTSQDNNRPIKSSYFRVHYDVEKMKEDLKKSTGSYNSKFSEMKSKGTGMTQLYKSSISNLEGQKSKLEGEIASEANTKNTGIGQFNDKKLVTGIEGDLKKETKDTTGIKQSISNSDDSASSTSGVDSSKKAMDSMLSNSKAEAKEKEAKLKAEEDDAKKRVAEKRKQIDALEKRINKYKILLTQYENTNHFDSTLGYDKTKDISSQSDMTYKQMAKRSTNMLPDGRAKSFIAGITTMDAGTFPKDQSKYTMAGQMMKGLDFGYDLGFCETGATVGKTQYVGRDGSLDKYTCYSGKATFKPLKKQKISLLYYGYSPDRKMITGDAFFNNANISAPSFFQPVNIISTAYDGSISKYVTINSEVATSMQQSDRTIVPQYSLEDKMAYHFSVDGRIPKTTISLLGSYDKTGMGFVNNTLPLLLTGTEQYKISGRSDFLHSFLTLGIEYDQLIQNNFASKGTSTKWGFDIKTNSKKYPNISLSYKPFTTFQAYTDTLTIPQRPLLGSVWIGKATYQIRMHQKSIRFSVIYNQNTTTSDTSKYGSTLMQLSCIYSDKIMTNAVNVGQMQLSGTNVVAAPTIPNTTTFLNHCTSYALNKKFSVSGGEDFGVAPFGFCRYSINGGVMYHPVKYPVMLRMNLRYNRYKLNEGDPWQEIYSGNIDLTYRFKSKVNNKAN